MRPSPRLVLMTPPPPLGDLILGRLGGGTQALCELPCFACFADKAGARAAHGTPAGPRQVEELSWERRSNLGLRQVIDGVNPLDARLAQLARAVALVHRVEYPALARTAVLDVSIRGEGADRDACAARRVDRHLAGDEGDRQIVDRDRLQRAEVEPGLRIAERPVTFAAPGQDRFDCALL